MNRLTVMHTAADGISLYLSGGRQKARSMDEWHAYEAALILRVDGVTGKVTCAVEYYSPPETCPATEASINFKASSLSGHKLYVATNTEIMAYELPSFRRIEYLSLPSFNDLHYVCQARDGNLLVTCTGLDMVVKLTPRGETLSEWAALGGDPWERFSPQTDYRKLPSTKPHASHPNFVLETGDDIWVTRCNQKDAVSLVEPGRRVEFAGPPHDGVRKDGRIYFTTVNAFVHIVDEATMQLTDTIDLNDVGHTDVYLGWMRGILPVGGDLCWVGFTRLRKTKFQENVSWVKHGFRRYYLPTRIALYDLKKRELLREIDIEPFGMHAVYSILEEPAGIIG